MTYHFKLSKDKRCVWFKCPHTLTHPLPVDVSAAPRTPSSGAKWQLVTEEPLHIEPSIRVHPCNCHGFIRNGAWEPAPDSGVKMNDRQADAGADVADVPDADPYDEGDTQPINIDHMLNEPEQNGMDEGDDNG